MKDFSLSFPHAYGGPVGRAVFRSQPEDFCVDEELGWEPSGGGEHVYLQIKKRGENTAWIAARLAELAGVRPMDVGYCGLKDRQAVTCQWFSVYYPSGIEPRWQDLPAATVLTSTRHRSKLRRGQHRGNHFAIRLRQMRAERSVLETRLRQIAGGGPNYVGEQRFGRQAGNLQIADEMLADQMAAAQRRSGSRRPRNRQKRGLMLSAARSYLFNLVLAQRVADGSWASLLPGEAAVSGRPTAPLWGRGRSAAAAEVDALEQRVLKDWQDWCHALEHTGLKQERRVTVIQPQNFSWSWREDDLDLKFGLAPGEFATSVLRELTALTVGPGSCGIVGAF